ncbi:hypothetical protein IE53DRAFT_384724 [Violaceomyces palustris]|uniref:Uncharacterized protein n=1 Tax=Violaceomyces palustris TaxID=1673888 RepID=A0ACD0P406_9BASI|nr:hypothetical protein IE53DRAFT_384724 [Violaceomyces palustris]
MGKFDARKRKRKERKGTERKDLKRQARKIWRVLWDLDLAREIKTCSWIRTRIVFLPTNERIVQMEQYQAPFIVCSSESVDLWVHQVLWTVLVAGWLACGNAASSHFLMKPTQSEHAKAALILLPLRLRGPRRCEGRWGKMKKEERKKK